MSTPYGYIVTAESNMITIEARPGLGDSMNGDNRLQVVISVPSISSTSIPANAFDNTVVNTPSLSKTFRVSGTLLFGAPGDITIIAPTEFEVSNDNATWGSSTTIPFTSDTLSNIPVYVRFFPTSTGTKGGNISITGGGIQTPTLVPVSGSCIDVAALTATPLSPFANTNVGSFSAPQIFDLSGVGLTNAPGVITITAPSLNFQVSNNGITWSESVTVPYTSDILSSIPVYVRYSPQVSGSSSGDISIDGGNATTTVAVSGVSTPALTVGSLNPFNTTISGSFSASQTFALSGVNLSGAPSNVTVTSPSTDFQVSLNGTTWGNSVNVPFTTTSLASTSIFVRFSPQSTGTKSGNISVSGGGASASVPVSGLSLVEASFNVYGLTDIKFDYIDTTNGFTIVWASGDEQTFLSGLQSNITKSYLNPYSGQIKIRATNLADIKKIAFAQGNDAPKPINNSTFTVRILQPELAKLTGLTEFITYESVKIFGITTLNLNRNLVKFSSYYIDINGNINDLPSSLEYLYLSGSSTSSLQGSINDLYEDRVDLNYLNLSVINTISGNINTIPATAEYFHVLSGNTISGNLTGLSDNSSLEYFLCNTNGITGSLNDVDWTSLLQFECTGTGAKTGDIESITFASGFNHFNVPIADIDGAISDFPSTVTFLNNQGAASTLSGTTSGVPSSCKTLILGGSTEITGALSSLPSTLEELYVTGSTSALTGTINDLPSNVRFVRIENDVHTVSGYTSGRSWGTLGFTIAGQRTMNKLSILGSSITPFDQTESNNLLIDLNNTQIWQISTTFATEPRAVYYVGLTPTGAGITAKTGLENKGVIVNNYTYELPA